MAQNEASELWKELQDATETIRLQQIQLELVQRQVSELADQASAAGLGAGRSSSPVACEEQESAKAAPVASSRRRVLKTGAAVLGASVAGAATLLPKQAAAADGDNMVVGQLNTASATTTLSGDNVGPLLSTINATGPAVIGQSNGTGSGVVGSAQGGGAGVAANNFGTGNAVSAHARGIGATAVNAIADSATGPTTAVQATVESADGVAIRAENTATSVGGGALEGVVTAIHQATSGPAYGLFAETKSVNGSGVAGFSSSSTGGVGVTGSAVAVDGIGGIFGGGSDGAAVVAVGSVGVSRVGAPAPLFAPEAPIHVRMDSSSDPVELLLQLESDVPPQQIFLNNDTGAKWFFAMTADDEFKISRDGTGAVEAKFFSNGDLRIAGTLIQASDVNSKHDLVDVDPATVLDALCRVPIKTWRYNNDPETTHIGPTSQDFAAAFGYGNTTTGIASVDADGVAFAAIQALQEQNTRLRSAVSALQDQNGDLRARIGDLEAVIA